MTPASATRDALLERITSGPSLLDSLHAAAALPPQAVDPDGSSKRSSAATRSPVAADARVARSPSPRGSLLLAALEGSGRCEREHAAWALGGPAALLEAVPALEAQHAAGGFGGMLAELTLERWFAPGRAAPP